MSINLALYQGLTDAEKAAYLSTHGDRLVNIYSGQHSAYWRNDYKGYTTELKYAGVYQLFDAIAATLHCGPEKQIKYYFVSENAVNEKPVNRSWEGEDIFDDPLVSFDKYVGIHRSGHAGNVK